MGKEEIYWVKGMKFTHPKTGGKIHKVIQVTNYHVGSTADNLIKLERFLKSEITKI